MKDGVEQLLPKEKKEEKRGFSSVFLMFSSPQERNSISSLFFHKVVVKSALKLITLEVSFQWQITL